MKQYRAIQDVATHFQNPILVKAGETVQTGKTDPDFPGWIWCTTADDNCGWAPVSRMEITGTAGRFLRDYNARELNLKSGDVLELLFEESGWAWCRKTESGEEGWAPIPAIILL